MNCPRDPPVWPSQYHLGIIFRNVPVKSNWTFNIPGDTPDIWRLFLSWGKMNLVTLVFPGLGHFITTQGVGDLIVILDFVLRVPLIPRGQRQTDEFKWKDCGVVADRLKTKGLHKLCIVFEGINIFECINILNCIYNIQYRRRLIRFIELNCFDRVQFHLMG